MVSNAPGIVQMTVKQVAQLAFDNGLSIGGNYIADREQMPERITFENGRVVTLITDADEPYLGVCWQLPRYEE